jgi:hypothetical protein
VDVPSCSHGDFSHGKDLLLLIDFRCAPAQAAIFLCSVFRSVWCFSAQVSISVTAGCFRLVSSPADRTPRGFVPGNKFHFWFPFSSDRFGYSSIVAGFRPFSIREQGPVRAQECLGTR